MRRNRHICTKFQENRHIFGSTKKTFSKPGSVPYPPPSFTSTRFDNGILPTPHFSTRLPSPSSLRRSGSFPTRSGPPQQISSTPVSRSFLEHTPFFFLPCPLPSFLHLLLIHFLSSRLFLFLPPPSHPCLHFLRRFTLFFFTFVKSHNVLCRVLS